MLDRELKARGLIEVPPRLRFSRSFLICGRYKDQKQSTIDELVRTEDNDGA